MTHMSMSFAPWAFLASIFNLMIIVGALIFIPYILFSINRNLGRIANHLEELARNKSN